MKSKGYHLSTLKQKQGKGGPSYIKGKEQKDRPKILEEEEEARTSAGPTSQQRQRCERGPRTKNNRKNRKRLLKRTKGGVDGWRENSKGGETKLYLHQGRKVKNWLVGMGEMKKITWKLRRRSLGGKLSSYKLR